MSKQPQDDLFADTTMSFGEHLEELRGVLVKAAFALGVGFLVGLGAANQVVMLIQTPLKTALENYYLESARLEMEDSLDKNLPGDDLTAEEAKELREKQEQLMQEQIADRMVPDTIQIDAQALLRDLQKLVPDSFDKPFDPPDSLRQFDVQTWNKVDIRVQTLNAHEAFMIWMKAGFISGFVFSSSTRMKKNTSTGTCPSACCCFSLVLPWRSCSSLNPYWSSSSASTAPWILILIRVSVSG